MHGFAKGAPSNVVDLQERLIRRAVAEQRFATEDAVRLPLGAHPIVWFVALVLLFAIIAVLIFFARQGPL